MRKITSKFVEWCADNSPAAKLERTVAQGIIGVVSGVTASLCTGDGVIGTVVAPSVMVVLTSVQAYIGETYAVGGKHAKTGE